jgi:hypothetical protein
MLYTAQSTFIPRVYHSVCLLVRIGTPHSLSLKRVCLPHNQGGGEIGEIHTPASEGVGGSKLGRLEKKPSTLSILCDCVWYTALKRTKEKITVCCMCSTHFKKCGYVNSFVDRTPVTLYLRCHLHEQTSPKPTYFLQLRNTHKHGHTDFFGNYLIWFAFAWVSKFLCGQTLHF